MCVCVFVLCVSKHWCGLYPPSFQPATLLSTLSDEIKDKLLPVNPLIKEMSLIADKPLTQRFMKWWINCYSLHAQTLNANADIPYTHISVVKCLNMMDNILGEYFAITRSLSICMYTVFIWLIASWEDFIINHFSLKKLMPPHTAAAEEDWIWIMLCMAVLNIHRLRRHKQQKSFIWIQFFYL